MKDFSTLFIRKAVDILFLTHKLRTSIGVVIGMVFHGIVKVFHPIIEQWKTIIDIREIGYLFCISLGVLIMHIQTIYGLSKRPIVDEKFDNILQVIEEARKRNIPEWQIRQMYSDLYLKVLNDTAQGASDSDPDTSSTQPS